MMRPLTAAEVKFVEAQAALSPERVARNIDVVRQNMLRQQSASNGFVADGSVSKQQRIAGVRDTMTSVPAPSKRDADLRYAREQMQQAKDRALGTKRAAEPYKQALIDNTNQLAQNELLGAVAAVLMPGSGVAAAFWNEAEQARDEGSDIRLAASPTFDRANEAHDRAISLSRQYDLLMAVSDLQQSGVVPMTPKRATSLNQTGDLSRSLERPPIQQTS